MRDYESYTDEELIVRIRDGEADIADYIIEKYKNLVRKKAMSLYILGGDNDDLIQEGMIGLFKAIRDYDSGRDASFFTFADICVARQMLTALKNASRLKHMPLNQYVSLYSSSSNEDEEGEIQLINAIVSVTDIDPEQLMINNEIMQELSDIMEQELSELERTVLNLYIAGNSSTKIARILGRDEKSTDNALQRAKSKVRKCFKSKT